MIILVHPKRWRRGAFESNQLGAFWKGAGVPEGTPILLDEHLPLEDEDGKPIFCFIVKNSETRYWRGEKLLAEPMLK